MRTLEKRTYDERLFNLSMSPLLSPSETISGVQEVVVDAGGVTFGTPAVNDQPVTLDDGTVEAIGKVVQVKVIGGMVPAGSRILRTLLRVRCVTSSGDKVEGTFPLKLTDLVL